MIGFFTINGKSCEDFNMKCSDKGVYTIAEKDDSVISIPGRSGDLIISNNRYKNVKHSYPTVCLSDFSKCFSDFVNYILSQDGYMRIEDTFHDDEFYLAKYTGETDPKRVTLDDNGAFVLSFSRKPQRYLKDGENVIEYTSSGVIFNPTYMKSLPLVRVYGTGNVTIGSKIIKINTNPGYIDINCDTQNAYYGATNCNDRIELLNGEFWSIPSGKSNIGLGSGITKIEVTPKWWRL